MKAGPRYHIKPRRRREGKTDYRKRLALLKSRTIRIVIRKSINNTTIQFVKYDEKGDNIVASATSKELIKKYNCISPDMKKREAVGMFWGRSREAGFFFISAGHAE